MNLAYFSQVNLLIFRHTLRSEKLRYHKFSCQSLLLSTNILVHSIISAVHETSRLTIRTPGDAKNQNY